MCKQAHVGVAINEDKYKLTRYYYDTSDSTCKQFEFNGKVMNLNNFKSNAACEAICKTPLTATAAAVVQLGTGGNPAASIQAKEADSLDQPEE